MPAPKLTFCCELDTGPLLDLFADDVLIDDLRAMGAGVCLGTVDLSAERAGIVRRLNDAGVPVSAWQLLPKDDGYWYNIGNAEQAAARYAAFKAWTAEHGLTWDRIAIDIEPDFNDMLRAVRGEIVPVLLRTLRRLVTPGQLARARTQYQALVAQMHADGYTVERFDFGFLVDEHRAGSTLLQRLLGIVSPDTDYLVPMLYSSFTGSYGPAIVWSYAQDVDAVAVGSTGGGVTVDGVPSGDINALDWDALKRDLLLARHWVDEITIFSLEGCVEQGMLPRLKALDWDEPPTLPDADMLARVDMVRRVLRGVLWTSAQPAILAVIGVLLAWRLLRPRR